MYICTCCGKECNRVTNIFIVNNFCNKCLDLYYKGELGRKNEEKEEKEEEKED